MDVTKLTDILFPALPNLVQRSNMSGETVETEPVAAAIWQKLELPVMGNSIAQEALADFLNAPDDADAQGAFRLQLRKLLQQQPVLTQAIETVLNHRPYPGSGLRIDQRITGDRNLTIGHQSGGTTIANLSGDSVVIGPGLGSQPAVRKVPPQRTILILVANPIGSQPLSLANEVREIRAAWERSQQRDQFKIEQRLAVRSRDIQQALSECRPYLVHFSGHGIGQPSSPHQAETVRDIDFVDDAAIAIPEGVMLEDQQGHAQLLSTQQISDLFAQFSDDVAVVVLNACYSERQAEAIAQRIPTVIGMRQAIGDRAAIEFSVGFYDALFAGETVEQSFELGRLRIQLENIPENWTPILKQRQS